MTYLNVKSNLNKKYHNIHNFLLCFFFLLFVCFFSFSFSVFIIFSYWCAITAKFLVIPGIADWSLYLIFLKQEIFLTHLVFWAVLVPCIWEETEQILINTVSRRLCELTSISGKPNMFYCNINPGLIENCNIFNTL